MPLDVNLTVPPEMGPLFTALSKRMDERFDDLDRRLSERALAHNREHELTRDANVRDRAIVDAQLNQIGEIRGLLVSQQNTYVRKDEYSADTAQILSRLDQLSNDVAAVKTDVATGKAGQVALYTAIGVVAGAVGAFIGYALNLFA